jgi:Spy/CpxP family protein refolding chaperone
MLDLKIGALALAAGAVGLVGAAGYRAHGHGGAIAHHAFAHRFVDFTVAEHLKEIGATEAQKAKVTAIKDRLLEKARALHEERDGLHEELARLFQEDQVDAARVKALVRERTDAVARFGEEAADALVELHAVLTPEQRQKLRAGMQEHAGRHGH